MSKNPLGKKKKCWEIKKNAFDVKRKLFDIKKNAFDVKRFAFDIKRISFDVKKNASDVKKNASDMKKKSFGVCQIAHVSRTLKKYFKKRSCQNPTKIVIRRQQRQQGKICTIF